MNSPHRRSRLRRAGFCAVLSLVVLTVRALAADQAQAARERSFNVGWSFALSTATGLEDPAFDDSNWRRVDLPHDWSVEDLSAGPSTFGPYDRALPEGHDVGYLRGGTGWYRKHFVVAAADAGKTFQVEFDGVQQLADVWINGHFLGSHAHGYTPFVYDLTAFLRPPGETNVLAVRAVNPGQNSRWYPGSGLYREVTLHVTDRLHIPVWGVRLVPTRVAAADAEVEVEVTVRNDRAGDAKAAVEVTLVDPAGGQQTESIGSAELRPGAEQVLRRSIHVPRPQAWSPETPRLYRARAAVRDPDRLVDQVEQTFGLRTIEVSAADGLRLNGERLLLKGGCLHHDNGLLGAAAFPAAEERRVRLMKASGYNAIRTSHNPPSKAFLDACDRLGVVVIDEFVDMWERPKRPNDYSRHFAESWESDLAAYLRRDRNHPAVVMWSIGNEINERAAPAGLKIAANLVAAVRRLDPTRPVTNAICDFWDDPGQKWEEKTPAAFALLDVGGYNYQVGHYAGDHALYPNRVMMGTESFPKAALENWRAVASLPYVIGDFVWTGMDYIGESGVGHFEYFHGDEEERFSMPWPWWVSWCGDIDIVGNKKPQSLYRDVVWDRSPLEILVHAPQPAGTREAVHYWGWPDEEPHWTWTGHEGVPLRVNVYTKAERVRLELNGVVVGESAARGGEGITATFEVPYAPGTLKAVALTGGREVGVQVRRTAGLPAAIQLSPEAGRFTADRDSLLFVPIEIVDTGGQVVPAAASRLTLQVEGAGEVLAFGNGSPWISGSLQDAVTEAFRGRALAIIRSTGQPGPVKITVSSAGLRAGVIEVPAAP